MMFFIALVMQLFISQSYAQNIDSKLQKYIVDFKLRSLDKTTVKNQALFNVGRELFFDKTLSGNKNISCAECHHPSVMTHDGLPLALGEGSKGLQSFEGRRQGSGKLLARNSPALFNLTNELPFMFWDGRVSFENGQLSTPVPLRQEIASTITSAIAAQALFPMVDHAEMRGASGSNPIADANTEEEAWDLLAQRIENIDSYKKAFAKLYPGEKLNIAHIAEAIAEFEREAFFFTNTSYDRYLRGDLTAMTEIQKLGMDVFFNKGKCGECHNGANLTNFEFHNIATPQIG